MKDKQKADNLTAYIRTNKSTRYSLAAVLSFLTVCALPWAMQLGGKKLQFTNSLLSVFVFAAFAYLLNRVLQAGFPGSRKKWILPGIFGVLFAFCMVAGTQLELQESVPFTDVGMWLSIVVLGVASTLLVRYFWDLLLQYAGLRTAGLHTTGQRGAEKMAFGKRAWLLRTVAIFLMFLPVFLAVYPGFFVYDAQDEYLQVVTRNFTTHHPLLHVLLLGGIIHLVFKITGSYNLGIACYTLFQMLVMSGIFGWCIEKLKARGMKKTGQAILTLYFGLCPVLVMFSLCSAKDGLFTGMLLLMTMLLRELFQAPEQFLENKGHMALLGLSALGMMLLRHNGFYALLVFVPFVLLYLRKYWKKATVYFLLILALYLGADRGLTVLFDADASENQEMLTVPIMQMARVYNTAKDLPEAEREILERYLPKEALKRYVPKVSDGVKIAFDNQAYEKDKGSFWKLWTKWGAKNPFTYVNAWFMTSYGFWYPDTVIDVYRGNTVFTYTYEDSSYFGYEVEAPGSRESKLPVLDEVYRRMSLEITQQKVPVVSMLFSPGALFWAMLFLMGFLWYAGEGKRAMAYVPLLLIWLTVILGPTYLVRYVVFLWCAVPLLLWEVKEAGVRKRTDCPGER